MRRMDVRGIFSGNCPYQLIKLFFITIVALLLFSTPSYAKVVGLTVIINPEGVRSSARFIIQGQEYVSGQTVSVEGQTQYVVSFSEVTGWRKPANITVHLKNKDLTLAGSATTYEFLGGDETLEINDITKWPIWPRQSTDANVWEPYSFTSIGRDVVSWVTFDLFSENNPFFFVSDLRVIVRTGELTYARVSPNFDSFGQTYKYIAENTLKVFPSALGDILDDLRDYAVIPSYMENWMTITENDVSQDYPNQDFDSSWFSFSGWMDFLRGDAGFELEDSGHAPPIPMWPEDNWLTFFVDKNSVPSAWLNNDGTGKVFIFLPTNQGIVNCFEVSDDPDYPGATRVWSLTPFPAFQQAVYNQVYYHQNNEQFGRLTLLDGPLYVHDLQDKNGNWKRILVGSTGLGTEQVNKTGSNWVAEGAPSPGGSPAVTGDSQVFGIYAIDVTDPMNPQPLWSVTNINCIRSESASVQRPDIVSPGVNIETANFGAYENVDFMTSKPLIGFTETPERSRTWHLLLLTVDKDGQYLWINADPMTGEIFTSETFNGFDGETVEVLPSAQTYGYNFEDWYPSRILAAYPGEGGLPVLSDVYIYLSNGTFYSWDLNRYDWSQPGIDAPVPEKIFNVYTNTGHEYPAPPITDFDIAYIGGDTYLAATAPLDYPGWGSPHDTYGLLIVNLTRIQEEGTINLNTQGALGQSGDTKLRLMEDGVAMVQLQTGKGGNAYDFEQLAASPIFANYYLYQALYSTDATLSRLYTLDMGYVAGLLRGKGNVSLPDDAYIDDPDNAFAAMFIDSEGNLIILDADGNVVRVIEGVLDFSETGTGTGSTGSTGVRTVYWKTM
jgi:hypothetical protein